MFCFFLVFGWFHAKSDIHSGLFQKNLRNVAWICNKVTLGALFILNIYASLVTFINNQRKKLLTPTLHGVLMMVRWFSLINSISCENHRKKKTEENKSPSKKTMSANVRTALTFSRGGWNTGRQRMEGRWTGGKNKEGGFWELITIWLKGFPIRITCLIW